MPPCAHAPLPQGTPRPDNSAQFLTQWRYGSWTAVSYMAKQITKTCYRAHTGPISAEQHSMNSLAPKISMLQLADVSIDLQLHGKLPNIFFLPIWTYNIEVI